MVQATGKCLSAIFTPQITYCSRKPFRILPFEWELSTYSRPWCQVTVCAMDSYLNILIAHGASHWKMLIRLCDTLEDSHSLKIAFHMRSFDKFKALLPSSDTCYGPKFNYANCLWSELTDSDSPPFWRLRSHTMGYSHFVRTLPFRKSAIHISKAFVQINGMSYGPKFICSDSSWPKLLENAYPPAIVTPPISYCGRYPFRILPFKWELSTYWKLWYQVTPLAIKPNLTVIIAHAPS